MLNSDITFVIPTPTTNTLLFLLPGAMVAFVFRSSWLEEKQTVCEHRNRRDSAPRRSIDRLFQLWRVALAVDMRLLFGGVGSCVVYPR